MNDLIPAFYMLSYIVENVLGFIPAINKELGLS